MDLSEINVTPRKLPQFKKKNIFSVEDLLHYLPTKYHDCTRETGILPEDQISCVVVRLNKLKFGGGNGKKSVLIALCTVAATGERLSISWFNTYMYQKLLCYEGHNVLVAGKIKYNADYNNYQICTPVVFEGNLKTAFRMVPSYPKIQGMAPDYLTSHIELALNHIDLIEEVVPESVVNKLGLLSQEEAIKQLHKPDDKDMLYRAEIRLMFNDLLYFALKTEWAFRNAPQGSGFFIRTLGLYNKILKELPYELTEDQARSVEKMIDQVRAGKRLNALVQGDVGCGKTIVAFLMMAVFAGNGYQTVLMAPMEVLAKQHYNDLVELVEPFGYEVAYLDGGMKAAEKKAVIKKIAEGDVKFIVGTQAVVSKSVTYNNLALAITDEEHKFGVTQRNALIEKAAAGVHQISMSATPIPQSLAQVLYGDMVDLYPIQTMPQGRKPVITGIARSREAIYHFLVETVKRHHQAYVVCTRIEDDEKRESLKSVQQTVQEYEDALTKYGIRIGSYTSQDKKKDKEAAENTIQAFRDGEIDILIATTVIEVGFNVPNATAIVIVNADQFGLATLHQLRGRVGRGKWQSYCVFESGEERTEEGQRRLDVMCKTINGFEIAREDLMIRGVGDFIGIRQSGRNRYMSLIMSNPKRYAVAKTIAKQLLDEEVECPLVNQALSDFESDSDNE